jgi:hypothetical protein
MKDKNLNPEKFKLHYFRDEDYLHPLHENLSMVEADLNHDQKIYA